MVLTRVTKFQFNLISIVEFKFSLIELALQFQVCIFHKRVDFLPVVVPINQVPCCPQGTLDAHQKFIQHYGDFRPLSLQGPQILSIYIELVKTNELEKTITETHKMAMHAHQKFIQHYSDIRPHSHSQIHMFYRTSKDYL